MTTTTLRATVRRRINQTDNTNTNFTDAMIDELGNQARRMFAAILPERMLTDLVEKATIPISSGIAAYPSDFLRHKKNKRVLIDLVFANRIVESEQWRLRYLESNDNVKSSSTNKYYMENDNGVVCLPSTDSNLYYVYIKKPADLSGVADTTLPLDVDDMVVDYVFEKLMGTRRGDKELAVILARNRGLLTNTIMQKEAV